MDLKAPKTIATDVLVIGGGGGGLRAAIEARKHNVDVLLVSKSRVGFGNNTAVAGGGLGAVTGLGDPKDTPEVHFKDTLTSGRFLNDQSLVKTLTRGAGQQVSDLETFGTKFVKQNDTLWFFPVPGHTYPRTLLCEGTKGTGFTRPLRRCAENLGVQFLERVTVTKLLKRGDSVLGAVGVDEEGGVFIFQAKSTVLAAGGIGELFLRTNNAPGATADGYALAYDAGVPLKDMEFVQFYPTAFDGRGTKALVLYETFISIPGIVIMNSLGEDIQEKYGIKDPLLATRDRMARSIMLELLGGRDIDGKVVIDCENASKEDFEKVRRRIPGLTPDLGKFMVAPTVHFFMGGAKINEKAETNVDGLYAAGEISGGVHGANRLGSNAITDILVFGAIAGENAAEEALGRERMPIEGKEASAEVDRLRGLASSQGEESLKKLRDSLKETMWYKVGVVRNKKGLEEALTEIQVLKERYKRVSIGRLKELPQAVELGNMLTISEVMARAALERTESRGAHYRSDYPEENSRDWLKNIVISPEKEGMALSVVPVDLSEMAP